MPHDLQAAAIAAGIDPRGMTDAQIQEELSTSSAAAELAAVPRATAAFEPDDDDDQAPVEAREHAADQATLHPGDGDLRAIAGGGEGPPTDGRPMHVKLRAALERLVDDVDERHGDDTLTGDAGFGQGGWRAGAIAQLLPAVMMAESHAEREASAPSALLTEAIAQLGRVAQLLAGVQEIEARPITTAGDGFETPAGPVRLYRTVPEGYEDIDPGKLQDLASRLHAVRVGQAGGR